MSDPRLQLEETFPRFYAFIDWCAFVIALPIMPAGFVIGAMWSAFRAGYALGRDV